MVDFVYYGPVFDGPNHKWALVGQALVNNNFQAHDSAKIRSATS